MASFSQLLQELTSKGSQGVPAIVAVASQSGKDIVKACSGYRSLDDDAVHVSFDSVFQYSSATKIVTAIAALQCVERGLIGLDDSTAEYLPELKDQPVVSLENTEGQQPQLRFTAGSDPITLRQLLTHTSGLASEHMDPRLQAWRKSRGEEMKAFGGNAIDAFNMPLVFEPGKGWAYGASFEAIGVLVSRLNGDIGLEQYMKKNIFEPLGLRTSTFMPEDDPTLPDRLVHCVARNPDGTLTSYQHGTGKNPSVPQGGGGLYTTAFEHHAILADMVSPEPKLLNSDSVDLLLRPQLEANTPAMAAFEAMRPLLNSLLGNLVGDLAVNHCFGGVLIMDDSPVLGKTKYTVTWAGGTGSFWFLNRERRLAASYASQIFPIMDPKCQAGIGGFVNAIWKEME